MSHGNAMRVLQQKWFQLMARMRYVWKAGSAHHIHSPFLFELYSFLIKGNDSYYCFPKIEQERMRLLRNHTVVTYEDLGAGSVNGKQGFRSISKIARTSLKSEREAALLFKLCNRFQPATVIEMGTCLGISTAYMAMAVPKANVITMEGATPLLQQARQVWTNLRIHNIQAIEGNFMDTLPKALEQSESPCFYFLDGDHSFHSMMHYWRLIHPQLNEESILVVDDIHWSPGMQKFWQQLIQMEDNKLCIDLFSMGIIFRKSSLSKEDLTLAFS